MEINTPAIPASLAPIARARSVIIGEIPTDFSIIWEPANNFQVDAPEAPKCRSKTDKRRNAEPDNNRRNGCNNGA